VSRSTAPAVPAWDPTNAAHVWQGVDGKAFYSNWGTAVDVFAPGGRGSIPFSYEYYRFNQVTQGLTRDNVYGVCASTTAQTGAIDAAGAPGTSATCAGQTNRYIAYAGTSMAAPHVAGLAALLYGELGGVRSVANRERVMQCIRATTDAVGPSSTFGAGRVNARRAVEALRAGEC
jgi:subtilisin family serine protease